jgi:actin
MATDIVAFDFGSSSIRCGAVTETAPTVVIPALTGKRAAAKSRNRLLRKSAPTDAAGDGDDGPQLVVGEAVVEQLRSGASITVQRPVQRGVVASWDDAEQLLNHCFELLLRPPDSLSVVLAVPAFNPSECTERMVQTLFEAFDVQRVATVPQGLSALYASGRTTGIVLDVGHGLSTVSPVFDSFPVDHAMNRMNVGGADVSDHFSRVLLERGYTFHSPLDQLNLAHLKESVALVADDYGAAFDGPDGPYETRFEMPDGSAVTLAKERFRCSEVLFSPEIIQSEQLSLGDFVAKSIQTCGIDIRRSLSSNIVLSGGTTLMPGFAKRLQDEVARRFPGMFGNVNVIETGDRTNCVWSGAAVLANMPTFEPYFVTREVYDESGPSVIHGYYDHAAAEALGDDDDAAPPPPPDDD